jgi:hypothetical protein
MKYEPQHLSLGFASPIESKSLNAKRAKLIRRERRKKLNNKNK